MYEPGKCDLRGLGVLLRSDLADHSRRLEIGVEILALIARVGAPIVAFRIVFGMPDIAGQKAPAKQREGHKSDAELARDREDVGFQIALQSEYSLGSTET